MMTIESSNSVVKIFFWPATSNEDKKEPFNMWYITAEIEKRFLFKKFVGMLWAWDTTIDFPLISLWSLPPHLTLPCCEKWSCENQRDVSWKLWRNRVVIMLLCNLQKVDWRRQQKICRLQFHSASNIYNRLPKNVRKNLKRQYERSARINKL
jgi:hypothetical protein